MRLSATVAGATGLIGKHLVQELAARDEYADVTALVRRPVSAPSTKVTPRVIDFDALPNVASDVRPDAAFCCLGTTMRQAGSRDAFRRVDHDYVLAFAEWAKRQGCRRLLAVSALGADPDSGIFYNRVKGETEAALRVLDFERLVIVRPSLLRGERDAMRVGERVADLAFKPIAPLMLGPFRRYRPIAGQSVARAMVRLSLDEGPPGVRLVESHELTALGQPAPSRDSNPEPVARGFRS